MGYKVGRYIYNSGKSICVKVPDTEGRRVEVKFETEPPATFCVRSITGVENEESCTTVSFVILPLMMCSLLSNELLKIHAVCAYVHTTSR